MNKTPFKILVIGALCFVAACRPDPVRKAIDRQLEQYPASRVQDIYKSFCQDNLGPGHLIPNIESARAYLMQELDVYKSDLDSSLYSKPSERFVPVGDQGNYVRVDLSVVLDSLVDAGTLLDAFFRSANEGKRLTADEWKEKWGSVATVIRKYYPDIPDADNDLAVIDSLMAEGHMILHHSKVYEEEYHPHYRIVAKGILDRSFQ